jgi:hypothetical protein
MALLARLFAVVAAASAVLVFGQTAAVKAASASNCSLYSSFTQIGSNTWLASSTDLANTFVINATEFSAGETIEVQVEWNTNSAVRTVSEMSLSVFDGGTFSLLSGPTNSTNSEGHASSGVAHFAPITLAAASPNNLAFLAKPTFTTSAIANTDVSVSIKCTSAAPPPTPVTVTINQAAAQADPTATPTAVFDVVFSEAVTGFDAVDVNLVAPAGAATTVSGAGANYTVTVTGMTAAGVITASIPAGAAQSAATSTANGASTSTDNSVTYLISSPTTDSAQLDDVQDAATGVAANLASEAITDSVAEEIAAAMSGQVQVMSASEGKVGLVYAPGMGKGTMITPTADVASGGSDMASWRIWSSLRYTDFNSNALDGDQVNAMLGASILFGDGLVAGLVAGYEDQDYEDAANATLRGEGFNIGSYVGGNLGSGLRFDAQVHASFLDYDMASGAVTGSTDATRLIVGGGFAHSFEAGAFTIEPTARFSGTWEWQDAYSDSAAVAHAERDFHFGRLSAGTKIMHRFDLGDGASFTPFVTGFADYRYSGGSAPAQDSLMDGMSARIGLGLDFQAGNGVKASALGEFSGLGLDNNATAKSFKAQVAIPF